jgi:hypothetical protein
MMLHARLSWSLPNGQVFRCDIIHQTLPFQIRVKLKYGWGYCNILYYCIPPILPASHVCIRLTRVVLILYHNFATVHGLLRVVTFLGALLSKRPTGCLARGCVLFFSK